MVYTIGRDTAALQINVLAPPRGVEFEEWADALSDIISDAYLLMQGARNVLREALLQAHRTHKGEATLVHAHELLRNDLATCKSGSRRYGWLESSTRSLEELTKGRLKNALNVSVATIGELLNAPVVFELEGLADDQKRFFCLYVLQAVLLLRKHEDAPREVLRHALIFDEAHNVFPKEKYGEISVASRLAREIREYGEAIISATQQSDINESIIANSGTKIILRCDYPRDISFASQLLQLKGEHLPRLKIGEAIVRLPSRYLQPYLITFDEQPLKNERVKDEEIRRAPIGCSGPEQWTLSAREELLLRDIATHPISTVTERYARLGWHPETGNRTRQLLIEKRLATFETVATEKAQLKILQLTDSGWTAAVVVGITRPRSGKGGATHEYWRARLTRELQRLGYDVQCEVPVNGGAADLAVAKRGRRVLIEIETGKSDLVGNIAKCAPEALLIFCTNAKTREFIEHTLAGTHRCLAVLEPRTLSQLEESLSWLLRSDGGTNTR